MSKVNILSIQIQPKIGYQQKNLQKIREFIEKYADTSLDLVVLPEFFNSGVSVPEFKKMAQKQFNDEVVEYLGLLAKKHNTYILAGSIMEQENGRMYNTSRLLNRNGEQISKYRKIHLFDSFGGTENEYCTAGDEIVVAQTDFGKVGISVCFDIRFPKHFLNLVKNGAELILEPAAWCAPNELVEQMQSQWVVLNRARAVDNLVYFVSSNLCGKVDSTFSACGHSMIVSPDGEVLAEADNEENAIFATIDLDYVRQLRSQFCMDKLVG